MRAKRDSRIRALTLVLGLGGAVVLVTAVLVVQLAAPRYGDE